MLAQGPPVSSVVSVAGPAPSWQITDVRRSHLSGSVIHAWTSGRTVAGSARSSGPIRRLAISSVKSHQAPVVIQCRSSGTHDASSHRRWWRCPVSESAR
jgi:hypothetical protein